MGNLFLGREWRAEGCGTMWSVSPWVMRRMWCSWRHWKNCHSSVACPHLTTQRAKYWFTLMGTLKSPCKQQTVMSKVWQTIFTKLLSWHDVFYLHIAMQWWWSRFLQPVLQVTKLSPSTISRRQMGHKSSSFLQSKSIQSLCILVKSSWQENCIFINSLDIRWKNRCGMSIIARLNTTVLCVDTWRSIATKSTASIAPNAAGPWFITRVLCRKTHGIIYSQVESLSVLLEQTLNLQRQKCCIKIVLYTPDWSSQQHEYIPQNSSAHEHKSEYQAQEFEIHGAWQITDAGNGVLSHNCKSKQNKSKAKMN